LRKSFGILLAIIIMVVIALFGTYIMTISSIITKQTQDTYLRTQAELLARSATEYAIFRMSEHNYSTENLTFSDINVSDVFDINITYQYIGDTPETNGTAVIDVIVTTRECITNEPIRFHRRTVQKP